MCVGILLQVEVVPVRARVVVGEVARDTVSGCVQSCLLGGYVLGRQMLSLGLVSTNAGRLVS